MPAANSNRTVIALVFRTFVNRILPNAQAVSLALILIVISVLIYSLSGLLMPVFASVVLAYLLEGIVAKAEAAGLPRWTSVYLVFSIFMAGVVFLCFYLLPIVSQQAVEFVQQIPAMVYRLEMSILRLPKLYPKLISQNRIQEIMLVLQREVWTYGQNMLSMSAASLVSVVSAIVYLFLVPMMVFFFLKDKKLLIDWFLQFIPSDRYLTARVWEEVDIQIGNYIRGKFAEVFILWAASFITFRFFDLNYAMLLAVFMGLQVIIPYIGATLVTFPVLGVAYFQWGWGSDEFVYVAVAYAIIQALDGVLLVPILFSEAVNLHAIAIIVAILFFGGLWGFWGVFFAIPLATVVKAVLSAWPRLGDPNHDSPFYCPIDTPTQNPPNASARRGAR
ncbi:AI-2E family transporter [Methylomicrobium sp. RS1]|jgi:putative permease|uniref:AI-2E family transporter n=1 Tax=Candidatus Methylomicrobium oryzae TaxID=2802053 RepID=UPI0019228EA4|nr:AI-2E family transporter [Methylomicrobium sp. RS1]MBL1263753.1 AI-2E family transporter [Methylomicrobium sp. RS1]